MKADCRLAVCQMKVTDNKEANLVKAVDMLEKAAAEGARIALLPEMFNCPYDNARFPEYAEATSGETASRIAEIARKTGMYVAAGSIPERYEDKLYNSCMFFDPEGELKAVHRKVHLFDIDVKGRIRFVESEMLSPGNHYTVVETDFGKVGLAICYDLRFPELFRLMVGEGAEAVLIPAAFNMVTGPAHWEVLLRARAIDNQVYIAAASPARDISASYTAYGHSMIVDPWGSISAKSDETEGIIYGELVKDELERVRRELPLLKHRRQDLYSINFIK